MGKMTLLLFVVGFWLFLPIPFMLMNIGEYQLIDTEEIDGIEEPNAVNIWDVLKIYWRVLFFTIPNANIYIQYILLFFKVASVLGVFLVIRGD